MALTALPLVVFVVLALNSSKSMHRRSTFKFIKALWALVLLSCTCLAQDTPWSQKMSETAMALWPPGIPRNWNYEQGVVMAALSQVYQKTGDPIYLKYIKDKVDYFVSSTGAIRTYSMADYNLDHIASGRALLFLHQSTGLDKYKLAAQQLREQLRGQPRTTAGGFWHKKIYPHQMWLDGLYMAEPFYAHYSMLYQEEDNLKDIAQQFIVMEQRARDPHTGLLYHGWDESRQQAWAHPSTGCSPSFWGRALGWYAMGLVDVLDHMPKTYSQRDSLVAIFQRLAEAVVKVQDDQGLWWQVLDQAGASGNYPEASASCMLVYALAKGVRQSYIDGSYWSRAVKGYAGILKNFTYTDGTGLLHSTGTCTATGLGGSPYRDGSYSYYTSVPQSQDDARGVGPFIMASLEIEQGFVVVSQDDALVEDYVLPNPVSQVLQLPQVFSASHCVIHTASGQTMYEGSAKPPIDIQTWPRGAYSVELMHEGSCHRYRLFKD